MSNQRGRRSALVTFFSGLRITLARLRQRVKACKFRHENSNFLLQIIDAMSFSICTIDIRVRIRVRQHVLHFVLCGEKQYECVPAVSLTHQVFLA